MQKIRISGVHLAGKTTVAIELAQVLEEAGFSVYVFPEMSFPTKIKIGTIPWQLRLRKQILFRNKLVNKNHDEFDYIILDRDVLDVDIYTSKVKGNKRPLVMYNGNIPYQEASTGNQSTTGTTTFTLTTTYPKRYDHFILSCDIPFLIDRGEKRLVKEPWRKEWNELDEEYLEDVSERFLENAKFHGIPYIENLDTTKTVDKILNKVY